MTGRRRGAKEKEKTQKLCDRANQAIDQSIPPENRAKTLFEIHFLEAEPLREVA